MNYLLDTNIVLIYIRDNDASRAIEKNLNLLSAKNNLLISAVSIGELKSIAKQNNWGEKKIKKMVQILRKFLVTKINTEEIIERYAEIDAFSQGKLKSKPVQFTARNMGKNDLWIAATSSVYNLELVTTDSDFNHLNNVFLPVNFVKMNSL